METNQGRKAPTSREWIFGDGRHGSFFAGFAVAALLLLVFSIRPKERVIREQGDELTEIRSCVAAGEATTLESLEQCLINSSTVSEAMYDAQKRAE